MRHSIPPSGSDRSQLKTTAEINRAPSTNPASQAERRSADKYKLLLFVVISISFALVLSNDYSVDMNNRNESDKSYKLKESYRKQAYAAVISRDRWTNSWAWKGHVDFDAGLHSIFTNRTFATALQAEEHMRQSAHQCIDNRLG